VSNGVVYVGSNDGNVYALDANTGVKLWNYNTHDVIAGSSPAVADGVVVIGGSFTLNALNAKDGTFLWSDRLGASVNSPAIVDGIVLVGTSNDTPFSADALYALNGKTGVVLWSFGSNWITSSPAAVGGVVYAGSWDGNLYALDARTGKKLWSFLAGGFVISSPAVANGVVYVGNDATTFYALDATTGAKLWESPNLDIGSFASPVVADGMVYLPAYNYTNTPHVYAFGVN
jgi:outer membrane protein assembly factor BamB